MEDKSMYSRKATLSLKISEFEVPPMQDLLIIGKKSANRSRSRQANVRGALPRTIYPA